MKAGKDPSREFNRLHDLFFGNKNFFSLVLLASGPFNVLSVNDTKIVSHWMTLLKYPIEGFDLFSGESFKQGDTDS